MCIRDSIKSAGKKAYEIGKKVAPYVATGIDIARTFGPLIAGLGEENGGVLMGDQEHHHYGGTAVGGKMMKRSKLLKNRLRRN